VDGHNTAVNSMMPGPTAYSQSAGRTSNVVTHGDGVPTEVKRNWKMITHSHRRWERIENLFNARDHALLFDVLPGDEPGSGLKHRVRGVHGARRVVLLGDEPGSGLKLHAVRAWSDEGFEDGSPR